MELILGLTILVLVIFQPIYGLYIYSSIINSRSLFDIVLDVLQKTNRLKILLVFRCIYVFYFFIFNERWLYFTIFFSLFLSIVSIGLKYSIVSSVLLGVSLSFSLYLGVVLSFIALTNGIFRIFINWSLILNSKLYLNNREDILDELDQLLLTSKFTPFIHVGKYIAHNSQVNFHPAQRPPISTWNKAGVVIGGVAAVGSIGACYVGYQSYTYSKLQYLEKVEENRLQRDAILAQREATLELKRANDLKELELKKSKNKWL